jgi:hypothetical protein
MEKYLQYLHADIEAAVAQATSGSSPGWVSFFPEEEEDSDFENARYLLLPDIYGIPAEAFPPQHLLDDVQILSLSKAIQRLWKSWKLYWQMPQYLSSRQEYAALLREMKGEKIKYHYEWGGEVKICRYKEGHCPFQPNDGYCYCQHIEDCAAKEIAAWEDYVRSMGLDPYRQLSPEEEAALEEELRCYDLRKRYGDDWRRYRHFMENDFDEDNLAFGYAFDEDLDEFIYDEDSNYTNALGEDASIDDWFNSFDWEDEDERGGPIF